MRYETAGIIREVMGGNMDTVLVIYVELLLYQKIEIIYIIFAKYECTKMKQKTTTKYEI